MMQRLLHIGKTWPLHLLLLPFYFIFHAWVRFAGLLNSSDCLFAFLKILAAILILFFLLKFLWKSAAKAAVLTATLGITYLFFGDIKYTLDQFPFLSSISHYKIFIPLLILLLVLIFYRTHMSRQLYNTTLFLNCLLLIYIIIDVIKLAGPSKVNTGIAKTKLQPITVPNRSHNIYYLLLDCYPSPGYQQEMLGMTNSNYLDSSLEQKGFYVVKEPRSNYNNTAFSMASAFGMNYLTGLDTINRMEAHHYNRAMSIVKHSPLFDLLKEQAYTFYNFSIFDILDQPAIKKDAFLSATTSQILFYNTAWNCFKRDLLWQIRPNKKATAAEQIRAQKEFFDPQKAYNLRLLDTLVKFEPVNKHMPFFLYAHLEMPHFPYFFDSTGTVYPDEAIYHDSLITDKKKFAGYIHFANKKAIDIVDHFLQLSGGDDIIIVQSDHCIADMDWSRKDDAFRNYSAFYFPGKNYQRLYPGMSNVNTFRIILNEYFRQQLPLLPDKSFYTK